jgi:hypothetical protein
MKKKAPANVKIARIVPASVKWRTRTCQFLSLWALLRALGGGVGTTAN